MSATRLFPIQVYQTRDRKPGTVRESVYMRTYEVYCEVYSPQPAMVDFEKGCRGGFSTGEVIAFLYASGFPKKEWRTRFHEALEGMNV